MFRAKRYMDDILLMYVPLSHSRIDWWGSGCMQLSVRDDKDLHVYATTRTCKSERPIREMGKSTGTVQRPHWGDSSSPSILMERLEVITPRKLPKTTVSLWLGRLVYFPLGGFLDE